MKKTLGITLAILLMLLPMTNGLFSQEKKNAKIQVALLLDTSGSMDGLIGQAKSQLWKVVNELATAKYEDETPTLEIALYEYGNDKLSGAEGYIKQYSQLTTDLDLISEKLFALKTDGGSEFCGWVIQTATKQLTWSKSNDDLKMIFIAGNEEFTQGSVDMKKACKEAIKNGIVVNTIFCGEYREGVKISWKEGADLADGKYMNIDHNQTIAHIDTPFDKGILDLNKKLNGTYVSYGSLGEANSVRQSAQDKNAAGMGTASYVNRAVSKSKSAYVNTSWDLVDASEADEEILVKLKDEELPEEMKGLKPEERRVYLDKKKKERLEIQDKINKLDKKRQDYIAKELKINAEENTLDAVLIKTIRAQANEKNYKFEK